MIKRLTNRIFLVELLSYFMSIASIMIDIMFAGKYFGVHASAACGYVMPIFTFTFAISLMLGTGTQSLCGKLIGKQLYKNANKVFNTSLLLAIYLSLIMATTGIVFAPLLTDMMGAQRFTETFDMSKNFITSLAVGLPAIMVCQVMLPILQIDNDRKKAIIAALSLTTFNPIFIIIFANFTNLGIFGIGLSTSLCFYVALFISVLHFIRKNNTFKINIIHYPIPNLNCTKQILLQGIPYAIANFCNAIFILYMNYLLFSLSDENAIAIFTILNSLSLIFNGIGSSLGSTTLLTSNILFGERNKELLINLVKTLVLKCILFSLILIILINVFCNNIVLLFIDNDYEIFSTSVHILRLYSLSLIFYSFCSCSRNLIQGSGHILLTQVECVLQNLILPIIFSYMFAILLGYNNMWWFYIAYEVATIVFIIFLALFMTKGKPYEWSSYLFVPRNFFPEKNTYINILITKEYKFKSLYKDINKFAWNNSLNKNITYKIYLVAEEYVTNVINHGAIKKKNYSLVLRILNNKDKIEILFRDNCFLYNPKKYINNHLNEYPDYNKNGINIIYHIASKFQYHDTLSLNNSYVVISK